MNTYSCGKCGGSISKSTRICPHCGVGLVGIRCTRCNFTGSESDFIGDRCPKCGSAVYVGGGSTSKPMGWGGIITSVIIIIGLFVLISWMYKNGWDPTIVFFFGLPFAIWLLYESVTSVKEKLEIDINLKCLFGHQWNNICKCKRCGEIRDEMHNWVSLDGKFKEKCSSCGKERERFTREEVKKLNDQQVLKEYVLNATSWDLEIVREVLIKITNQAYLKEIAINGSDRHIRLKALAKITDQVFLKELVLKDSDRGVRWIAVENITDQAFLKKIALEDSDRDVRKVALTKITDKAFLQENASINSYRK